MSSYESKWRKNQEKIEENYKNKIAALEEKLSNQILEVGLYQNTLLQQRSIFQEIIAICSQQQMADLNQSEKLKRIERYARRALASK